MDAFSVAAQLLGGLELGPGQLAQLRAIDSKYQQRLYTLLHASDTPARLGGWYSEPDTPGVAREPTPAELTELRAMLAGDIRSMLTPEQRGLLDRSTIQPDEALQEQDPAPSPLAADGTLPHADPRSAGRTRLAEDDVPAWESEGGGLD